MTYIGEGRLKERRRLLKKNTAIRRKGDEIKPYAKFKGYGLVFGLIKNMSLYKINYLPKAEIFIRFA